MSEAYYSEEETEKAPAHDHHQNCFKEAVCIDAMRVYDSCGDKDCLEDLRVYFTRDRQCLVDDASSVRIKSVDVVNVFLNLEPVPFNKGFYSVDMTFFFDVCVDVFCSLTNYPISIDGIAIFNKKVILYGSEGNVKIFNSDMEPEQGESQDYRKTLPKAVVQVAEPIALSAKLCQHIPSCDACCAIPDCICQRFGGEFERGPMKKNVYATIGMFTIVQILRNVQMLIPAYDFCIPEKECVTSSDNPCEMFSRIDFPTDEFFPPKVGDLSCGCDK
ncbi:MAG: hypothetical protein PUC32_03130 [Oscillospiraceae bacterium]|nr:hypothetical protein [Oscillospiraceae bacterium]